MAEAPAFFLDDGANVPPDLVLDAMRCWRTARDDGEFVQPCLYARLASYQCEMLAPVFDSLIALCEWALERCIVVGRGARPSADERFLLDMLIAPDLVRQHLVCAREVAAVFRCALYSTRLMMGLTLAEDRRTVNQQASTPRPSSLTCQIEG